MSESFPEPGTPEYTAAIEAEQVAGITHERARLTANITDARAALAQAHQALYRLTTELYDVEYAEGTAGVDIADALTAADRHLRICGYVITHVGPLEGAGTPTVTAG